MRFTRESEYGLSALLFLAGQLPDQVLPLSEIARASELPQNFLAKIFQKLAHHGVVRSFRGARRGYCLAREPGAIRVRELVEAIEGPGVFERCIFWNARCDSGDPCPLHDGWMRVSADLVRFLEETTLEDLTRRDGARRRSHARKVVGRRWPAGRIAARP